LVCDSICQPKNISRDAPSRAAKSHKSYRPVTIATFRLNRLISTSYRVQSIFVTHLTKVSSPTGASPVGYHAVNIVLHVLVTVLFARMCTRIVGPRLHEISAVASVMFATHPIHVEAV
jgi:hypothetical protein